MLRMLVCLGLNIKWEILNFGLSTLCEICYSNMLRKMLEMTKTSDSRKIGGWMINHSTNPIPGCMIFVLQKILSWLMCLQKAGIILVLGEPCGMIL